MFVRKLNSAISSYYIKRIQICVINYNWLIMHISQWANLLHEKNRNVQKQPMHAVYCFNVSINFFLLIMIQLHSHLNNLRKTSNVRRILI